MVIMDSKLILQEIQNKNQFVFKRLFETHYQDLVNYANKYLFNKDSSEDVVQEVFVFLWEKSGSIDIQTDLNAYMYAMVKNRCLNALKAIKIVYSSKIIKEQPSIENSYTPNWFPDHDRQRLHDLVLKSIEDLPLKMRNIVKLRFIENYRYNEIADELDVSINTVKTQLKRAKVKLAQLIVSLTIILFLF
jgi:RNA polymerase sigma-70 factor (ECF subfamily)